MLSISWCFSSINSSIPAYDDMQRQYQQKRIQANGQLYFCATLITWCIIPIPIKNVLWIKKRWRKHYSKYIFRKTLLISLYFPPFLRCCPEGQTWNPMVLGKSALVLSWEKQDECLRKAKYSYIKVTSNAFANSFSYQWLFHFTSVKGSNLAYLHNNLGN